MSAEFPYASRPEDVAKFFKLLPEAGVPVGKIEAGYFKKSGFTPSSGRQILDILKKLGFVDGNEEVSITWKQYATSGQRGLVLASAIKNAYAELFELVFCPYLEGDDVILDFLKPRVKASFKDITLMVQTFRVLCESADFQDIMCEAGPVNLAAPAPEVETGLKAKVNPNLQLNIQIHIDPATSDEKIEVIFKNMRKYLLGKKD